MMVRCLLFAFACVCATGAFPARADVTLPPIFSDHGVLQKAAQVPVWGKASPGEKVTVKIANQSAAAEADANGKWRVFLDLHDCGPGPYAMTVSGRNQLTISDVLVGEVWLASGQSNMGFNLASTAGAGEDLRRSANPQLRQFAVAAVASPVPLDECAGQWIVAAPDTAGRLSAVAYYFGKELQSRLQRPVGIINSSWGGTPVEAWISAQEIDRDADLKASKDRDSAKAIAYPAQKQAFVDAYGTWIRRTGREDHPETPESVTPFVDDQADLSAWQPVKWPGIPSEQGLPKYGTIWLRRTVQIPAAAQGKFVDVKLGAFDAFDSVYWNGRQIKKITLENFPGADFGRKYGISGRLVKAGDNVLAVRLYSPATPVKLQTPGYVGGVALTGPWMAKAEFALPDPAANNPAPVAPPSVQSQSAATFLFNGMISPLLPYAISGVIWYQGEANTGRAWQYRTTFPMLIKDWREHWQRADLPFYFCQLANYLPKDAQPGDAPWAELRDAQNLASRLPKTGQAVLIDSGEAGDIHPRDKWTAGDRLARLALAGTYGEKLEASGPVLESSSIEGDKIRLIFSHVGNSLVARELPKTYVVRSIAAETAPLQSNRPGGDLEGFAICGADRKWIWAQAKVDGPDSVLVWSNSVPSPVAVRYAWANNPTCNLYNSAGLPASPFRTDDFPLMTKDAKY